MNKTTYPEYLVGKEIHVVTWAIHGRRSQIDPCRMMLLSDVKSHLQDYFDTEVWPWYGPKKSHFFVYDGKGDRYYLDGSVDTREHPSEATGVYLVSITGASKEVNEI